MRHICRTISLFQLRLRADDAELLDPRVAGETNSVRANEHFWLHPGPHDAQVAAAAAAAEGELRGEIPGREKNLCSLSPVLHPNNTPTPNDGPLKLMRKRFFAWPKSPSILLYTIVAAVTVTF